MYGQQQVPLYVSKKKCVIQRLLQPELRMPEDLDHRVNVSQLAAADQLEGSNRFGVATVSSLQTSDYSCLLIL